MGSSNGSTPTHGITLSAVSALTPEHYAMLAQQSGIIDAVIAERGYRSIDGASGYTALQTLGFSQAQARLTPGLLLPLHTTDGQQPLTIYRPDHPHPDANGRLRKYLLPKVAGVRLDCPQRGPPSHGANGANGDSGASGASKPAVSCPTVGDWVLPLSKDGVIIPDDGFPPPYLITEIEQHNDGQVFARFLETGVVSLGSVYKRATKWR